MNCQIKKNAAQASDIYLHLHRCRKLFVPPLDERVDLLVYSEKLFENANRMELWHSEKLIGLVAMYFNESEHSAFITNVSIDPDWTRQGLGLKILQAAMDELKAQKCQIVTLEVGSESSAAQRLYESIGFATSSTDASSLFMRYEFK